MCIFTSTWNEVEAYARQTETQAHTDVQKKEEKNKRPNKLNWLDFRKICDSASCVRFTWSYISRTREMCLLLRFFSPISMFFSSNLFQNNNIQFKIHLIDISKRVELNGIAYLFLTLWSLLSFSRVFFECVFFFSLFPAKKKPIIYSFCLTCVLSFRFIFFFYFHLI